MNRHEIKSREGKRGRWRHGVVKDDKMLFQSTNIRGYPTKEEADKAGNDILNEIRDEGHVVSYKKGEAVGLKTGAEEWRGKTYKAGQHGRVEGHKAGYAEGRLKWGGFMIVACVIAVIMALLAFMPTQ